ncbi:TonB-dependent receptor, partial [bacterium]|nr:TonB-dependent receptor [bacterium]
MKYNTFFYIGFLCVLLMSTVNLWAATVRGSIHDVNNEPLLATNVFVVGTQSGASTDADGNFQISDIIPGNYTLRISLVGYKTQEEVVTVTDNQETVVDYQLDVDPIFLEEMNVRTKRDVSGMANDEPVLKEIIVAKELQEASTDGGLLTALSDQSGLTVRPCALCGSMGIGMQGLDPSYTEVNVDGLPVLSGLGTLYGLDGLSVSDVSEVQLVKGSSSSLFGSGAIAGAVNLVSAKSSENPEMRVSLSGSDTRQHTLSANLSHQLAETPFRLSASYGSEPDKVDRDDDGITDTPKYDRFNLHGTVSRYIAGGDFTFGGRFYTEQRFAGETRWTENDKGSADVYGRFIETNRREVSFGYASESASDLRFSTNAALVKHEQNSWYGTTSFDAVQNLASAKASLEKDWAPVHTTLLQGVFQYDDYNDNLNLGTPTDQLNRVPGIIAQHTWTIRNQWTLQGGGRLEHFNDYGWVWNPRGSALWQANNNLSFRLSGGTGFRRVSIFSIDKAVHAGFEHVLVPNNLEPEKSFGSSFAVNYRWIQKLYSITADVNTFYT